MTNPIRPEAKSAFEGWVMSEIENIRKDISGIKINHLPEIYRRLNRPSWLVLIIISFLSSLSVGLVVSALLG